MHVINYHPTDFNELEGFTLSQEAARAGCSLSWRKPQGEDDPIQAVPCCDHSSVPDLNPGHRSHREQGPLGVPEMAK